MVAELTAPSMAGGDAEARNSRQEGGREADTVSP